MNNKKTYNIVFVKTSNYFGKATFNNDNVTVVDYQGKNQFDISIPMFTQLLYRYKMVLATENDNQAIRDYKGTFFERQAKKNKMLEKLFIDLFGKDALQKYLSKININL